MCQIVYNVRKINREYHILIKSDRKAGKFGREIRAFFESPTLVSTLKRLEMLDVNVEKLALW